MTPYHLDIELVFENPLAVSSQVLPDQLEITFRCPYIFVSKNSKALSGSGYDSRKL